MKYQINKPPYLENKDKKERPELFTPNSDGVYPSEAWNLDVCIAHFLVPRLKLFKKNTQSYPASLTEDEWSGILDKMIEGFEEVAKDEGWNSYDMDSVRKADLAIKLFAKYFNNLWD